MSFLERAKQAAEQARQAAETAAERTAARMNDPATIEKTRSKLRGARRGLVTALERIDPGVLAEVVIKATTLQERANAALRAKGSPYRISEIGIGAAIPPSVTFTIARLDDPTAEPTMWSGGSEDVAGDGTITALDGTKLEEADLETLAGTPDE
jgi:hypothetical protein